MCPGVKVKGEVPDSYRVYEVTAANAAHGHALHKLSQSRLLAHTFRVIVTPEQLSGLEALVRDRQMSSQLLNADVGATLAEEFAQRQMQSRLATALAFLRKGPTDLRSALLTRGNQQLYQRFG